MYDTSDKTFYQRALELLENNDYNTAMKLEREFKISNKTVHTYLHSLFGKSPREYIKARQTPSKEECDLALALSTNVFEMRARLGVTNDKYWVGLLDKYYGYSTFQKCKALVISKSPFHAYTPTIVDNKSIFLSQYFGDGSYYQDRNALKIEHGYKQRDYLLWKVSLFNKAWPTTNGIEKIRERYQRGGYVSYVWYSGKLPGNFVTMDKSFKDMTPFGAFIHYLDDGCYHVSKDGQHIIDICVPDRSVRTDALEFYRGLGIIFTERKMSIVLQDSVKVANFLNSCVYPYKHMVPEAMQYKCQMKI
jgi:hypothetical protein